MGNLWKSGSHLKKGVTRCKMCHTEKWVTLQKHVSHWKMGHTVKKWVTVRKVGHIWRKGSHCRKMCHTEKWVTLLKLGHTVKNLSHLEKCVTFEKLFIFAKLVHQSSINNLIYPRDRHHYKVVFQRAVRINPKYIIWYLKTKTLNYKLFKEKIWS